MDNIPIPPGTQPSPGLIIGAAAACVGAAFVVAAIIWVCCKSRRARREQLLQPANLQDVDMWTAFDMDQQQANSGIAMKQSGAMPGKPDQASWAPGHEMQGTAGTPGMGAGTAGMPGGDAGLGAVSVVSGTISLVPLGQLAWGCVT